MPEPTLHGGRTASKGAQSLQTRRLKVLEAVIKNQGRVEPIWRPDGPQPCGYLPGFDATLDQHVMRDLEHLAAAGYLNRYFHDRLTVCPHCQSHKLNVREVCPSCGSSNIEAEPLLKHFRCGHVGRRSAFLERGRVGSQVCPKCNRVLSQFGIDHDSPGDHMNCQACGADFPMPPVQGICLSCCRTCDATEFQNRVIWRYEITPEGSAAARDGKLAAAEDDGYHEGLVPIRHEAIFVDEATREIKRMRRYATPASIVVLAPAVSGETALDYADLRQCAAAFRETLREIDLVGWVRDHAFALCLPQTPADGAELVMRRVIDLIGRGAGRRLAGLVLDTGSPAPIDRQIDEGLSQLAAERGQRSDG